MKTTSGTTDRVQPKDLAATVAALVAAGGRFIFLAATPAPAGGTLLQAMVAEPSAQIVLRTAELAAGDDHYPSLTPLVPGAFWYEREIHDLFGLVPDGHPRLDPLVFPLKDTGADRSRPGRPDSGGPVDPDTSALAGHVEGEGVFTIPYGPVRSGVFETVSTR
jgi:formate hydrogenlyase subunit 5